nr:hypothetical protein Iba_chr09dCG6350 [Ipomoea batatas]
MSPSPTLRPSRPHSFFLCQESTNKNGLMEPLKASSGLRGRLPRLTPPFAEKRKAGLPWSSDGATDDEEEDGWRKRSLYCMRQDFISVSCEIGWCSATSASGEDVDAGKVGPAVGDGLMIGGARLVRWSNWRPTRLEPGGCRSGSWRSAMEFVA